MLIQIILGIFIYLWNLNIIFPAPQIIVHSPSNYNMNFTVTLSINDYDYLKYPLKPNDDIIFKMRGEISENYKEKSEIDISNNIKMISAFETSGEFKSVEIYLNDDGEILSDKTVINR